MLQFQPVDGFDGFFPVLFFCALEEIGFLYPIDSGKRFFSKIK